jgi:glycogen phosphorylase
MQTVLINLNIEKEYQQALEELGYDLKELYKHEHEPALGNGGLGEF